MNNSKNWFDFIALANTLTKQGQKIDEYKSSIQILFEPSFNNHFFLQLQLDKDNLKWFRTTWQMLVDSPKFTDPIQQLKYIGQTIKPTISYESGETDLKLIEHILEFVKTISIKPQLDKLGGIVLDGCTYTLTIAVDKTETKYKWHYLPNDWTDLQELANMLDELNQKL
jgi:hypothetical protein